MRANLTFRSPLMWAVALLLTASCGEDTIVKGNETGDVTVGTDGQLDVGGVEDGSGLADGAGGEDSAVGDGSGGVDGVVSADADSGGGGEDSDATGTDDADATGTDDADAATDPDGAETGDDADASTAPDGSETSDDADGSTIGDTDTNANCPFGVDCACNTDADCDPIFVCVEKDGAKTCQSPCKPTDPADEVCDGLDNDCDGETDEGTCTDTACATSVCTQAEDKTWSCATTPTGAGPCDDGNACTEGDSCINGVCTGTSKNCDDGNPCTADSCDKNNGCDTKAVDGPCDDGNACTEGDACKDGGCVGAAKNCDDNNPCTTDSCDLAGACTVAMNDGAACDDGDACTGKDTCASGTCKGTTSCDDGDACTTDACESGKCTHTKSDCDDGNACTKDACDLAVGCTSVAVEGVIACDDNNPCTVNDACFGGGCTGSAKDCDDNDPCTADACDAGTGCTHAAADGACDDGDACTDNDACKDGKCAGGGAKDCDDGNPCTVDACSAGTCSHETGNDFAACDDGDACTGKDACAGGVCKGSETKACDDGNACTDDACDPKSGCVNTPNAGSCDDGNACTDKDACDGGTCKGSAKDAAACDDGNACTKDSCDPKLGCSSDITAGASCDDGEACTAGDTCDASGKCQPGANNCECKTDADCKDDGNLCNGTLVCQSNKCVTDPATVVVCDPGADTGCLVATCDPKTGDCSPTAVNEGKPCGDGNACTLGNTCAKGVCADGSTAKCDDGDACTTDACDAKTGACSTTPIEGCVTCVDVSACDDKDPCTADACKGGLCTHDAIAGCSKGPQLVTGKVTVGIPQANAGSAVTVSFEVTNSGLSAAGPFKIAVMLSKDVTPDKDDAIVQVIDVPGLSSKQSTSQKLSIVLPSTLASGTWQIVVLADSAAAIAEDDEADNSAAVAISINALPDLTIASWSTDKDFYGPGTYIQFAAVTKNIGGGKAPSNSVTRVYISADGNLAGATYMAQFGVGGLAAGGTQNHSGWVKLPTLKQGTYTLLVVADFTKTVAEGNEDNNVVSKKIQIGPVSNLRPTALNATGSYAGNVISASYAVVNDSNQGATAGARKDRLVLSKNATYSSDDIELGVYDRGALAAGKSEAYAVKVTLPKNLTTGTWYLVVKVDSTDAVPEISETDNYRYRAISVIGLPDLVPSMPVQTAILPGLNRTVQLRVDNKGFGTAGNSTARIYLSKDNKLDASDTIVATPGIASISAGGFRTVNVTVKAPTTPGVWYVFAVADYNAKINEYNESNNTAVQPLKVLDKSDLQPKDGKLSSVKVGAGETVTVSWSDTNLGDDTPTTFVDGIYLSFDDKVGSSDTAIGSVASGILASKATANRQLKVTIPMATVPGDYHVLVVVDRDGKIAESNETNNVIALKLTVTAPNLPDLQITAAEVLGTTTSINVGDDFDVQSYEKNAGIVDAGGYQGSWYLSTNATFDTNDIKLKTVSRPSLGAGKSAFGVATLRLPSNTPYSTRYLFYVIDSGSAVKESNEANNVSQPVKITAVPRPDLRIENMLATPAYGTTGTTVKLTYRIRNIGGATAGGFQLKTAVSLDDNKLDLLQDTVVATSNQTPIGAGGARDISVTFKLGTMPAGKQIWLGAFADSANAVKEANEANNITVVPFSTTSGENKANLYAEAGVVSTGTVAVGGSFNASVTYRNIGKVATGSWKARLVFSPSATGVTGGVEVASSTEASLQPGAAVKRNWKVTVPLDLPTTHRYLHILGDSANAIDESIETDNDRIFTMTVNPLPNLKIVSITSSNETPKANSNVTITVVIANTGAANAQNALLYLRRSTDATITGSDPVWYGVYVSLAPGAQVTITRTFYASSSYGKTIYVGARIDDNAKIAETDETDNVGVVKLSPQ